MATHPKPLIVLTYPIQPELIRRILAPKARVKIARNTRELARWIPEANGLITLISDSVSDSLLAKAKKLEVIGNYAVGFNNIDLAACSRRQISVVNTPGVLTRATAELALALLLASARRVPEGEALCRSGKFRGWTPDLLLGHELRGRTAVLVGQGRIGKETARLFRAIGLKIHWITRADSDASIERKLKSAQVLSLHVPLSAQTRHWLNARRISLLPRDAIVLNTTRGPVVDEKALIRALKKRRIFSAGLDVFENEPEIPKSLRRLPNVVLLPHVGSATAEAREAMGRLVMTGVLAVLNGKRPSNAVKFFKRHPTYG